MTEEEAGFDPSLKKKKKKKKTPFDLDGAGGEPAKDDEEDDADNNADLGKKKKKKGAVQFDDDEDADGEDKDAPADDLDDIDLESFGKKKKSKKKPLNLDDLDDALPGNEEDDIDLEGFGKKKKKKKRAPVEGEGEEGTGGPAGEDNKENEQSSTWADSDRDYSYDELLQRVFGIMKEKNPEMVAGEKKKFVMRPPQVVKVGTKKTAFVNFTEIAKMLHRQPKHLLSFLAAELGTVGAIDGNDQLIIKGRFQQKHMENVLRRYIKEYVTCHTCRSPDTILNKETRLFFLQCMSCHSRCSVQTIKTGFQAVTGKRSAKRNKIA
jgi:translation initiation factor 2 subunit 2